MFQSDYASGEPLDESSEGSLSVVFIVFLIAIVCVTLISIAASPNYASAFVDVASGP